ncbi:hypothetical protein ADK67_19435 [Saccharothrix sp. NRRL B-16348]|uniref:RICIN domain-containing protein n=1 Tax=Saccharothrix sp. NRRL B-16348 TaxID=1415542 RepID=UPI0006ADCEFC|nr:VWA domain-containing protein [Saccharothrix sp. NRRL B-16348]KOX23952.1 hypothetical protein ADK67_19435 [Saccharothrix sp. NRRL B-16348]
MASDFTFAPDRLKAYLTNKGSYSPKVTVTAPAGFTFEQAKFDIYFVADNTGSMGSTIDEVNKRANEILRDLRKRAQEVNADVHYGVGAYWDFNGELPFKNHQKLSENADDAVKALGEWTTSHSSVAYAEAAFYGLHQIAEDADGKIGWRKDAKRIIIWVGDAPSNDPIPEHLSGLDFAITEQVVTDSLKAQDISVIAISVVEGSNPGLNGDPVANGESYAGKGAPGQANRIADATGGTMADNLTSAEVVDRIIDLGKAQISKMGGLSLKAEPKLARYNVTATPDSAIPPATGSRQVNFNVNLPYTSENATPAKTKDWTYGPLTGAVELLIGGKRTKKNKVVVELVQADLSGTYELQNAANDHLLDLTAGGGLDVTPDQDQDHQRWTLVPIKDGGYLLENNNRSAENRYVARRGERVWAAGHDTSGTHQWMVIPEAVDERGYLFSLQPVRAWKKALGFSGGKLSVTEYSGTDYSGGKFEVDHKHNQLWRLNAI